MVCTRTSEDSILNIPEGSVIVPHLHNLDCPSAWSKYWPLRMT
jgi:hypothetical protein